jgi:hypothetical protein
VGAPALQSVAPWMGPILCLALLASAAAVGVWDTYATYGPGQEYTVSALVTAWARQWPVLPLLLGVLLGHLFWGGSWPTPPTAGP